jgi:hypothetical protein
VNISTKKLILSPCKDSHAFDLGLGALWANAESMVANKFERFVTAVEETSIYV